MTSRRPKRAAAALAATKIKQDVHKFSLGESGGKDASRKGKTSQASVQVSDKVSANKQESVGNIKPPKPPRLEGKKTDESDSFGALYAAGSSQFSDGSTASVVPRRKRSRTSKITSAERKKTERRRKRAASVVICIARPTFLKRAS